MATPFAKYLFFHHSTMAAINSTPNNIIVPWSFLADPVETQPAISTSKIRVTKSFAEAVNNVCDIPVSQLPQPVVKGDMTAIAIPYEEYEIGVNTCKHNLHGIILWPKGATPLKVGDLKAKLAPLWKTLGKWGVTSLGKGFYEFSFSSLEDVQSVRSINSWNLNPSLLKLFTWTKDFNPHVQQNSSAQVWLRIFGLSQEYWRPKILFAIASSVGTPICTDQLTNKSRFDREFGHFVRVLVDVDLKKQPIYRVLVERTGFAFFVDFEFENRPEYCHFCNCIGHDQSYCKRFNADKQFVDNDQGVKTGPNQPQKKVYAVAKGNKKPNNTEALVVSNDIDIASKQINNFDPMLDCMLKKLEARVPVIDKVAEVVFQSSPTPTHDHDVDPIEEETTSPETVPDTQPVVDIAANGDNDFGKHKSPHTSQPQPPALRP
jgi:hypothetical protein